MLKAVFLLSLIFGLMHPTYSSLLRSDDLKIVDVFPKNPYALLQFQIEKNFNLKPKLSASELLQLINRSVNEANPRHKGLTSNEALSVSKDVIQVSQCYGIDPVIFTSLIWRESNFKPASLSERGATGLTQMTKPGIQEVLERLSPLSHRRLGHLRALTKKCNPGFFKRVPAVVSADTLAAWKNYIWSSRLDALVMGALLLKIDLASVNPAKLAANRVSIYQSALERYNGDPKVKVQFALDVLLLSKRMIELPEVALNSSKFLSQIEAL